ncbi:MAG TPA: serine/threonine-protein kinase [Byssovorax sp.]
MGGDGARDDDAAVRKARGYVGEVLGGRYRVEQVLAFGGMGAVLKATHVHMRRQVALKVLHPSTANLPELVLRFERESIVNAHLAHPNVCAAMDFGQFDDGSHYLVLEYVDGRSLRDVLRDGPIEAARAAEITRQVADALGAAHALGIVHRDVKPGNVMVQAGERVHVKIVDFGLAGIPSKMFRADDDLDVTQAGTVFGTVAYMAPELAGGMHFVDARSDLYALGVMLFEMLAGVHPFESIEPTALFREHRSAPVPRVVERAPGVTPPPPALEAIARRLLEKAPERRFQTAEELVEALDAAVPPPPVVAHRSRAPGPSSRSSRPPPDPADDDRVQRVRERTRERASTKGASTTASTAASKAAGAAAAPARVAESRRAVVIEPAAGPETRRPTARLGALVLGLVLVGGAIATLRMPGLAARLGLGASSSEATAGTAAPVDLQSTRSNAAAPSAPSPSAKSSAASSTAAPTPESPSASAPASAAATASDQADDEALKLPEVVRLRGVMREAADEQDVKRGARALLDLANAAPSAFRSPEVQASASAIAVLVETGDRSMSGQVFDALSSPALAPAGLDVLFRVVCFSGGSRAAARSSELLARPDILARASPALRIARDLRGAACSARPALYDRAVTQGDERALTVLAAMRTDACFDAPGACCLPSDLALAAAVSRLRQRLHK